MLPSLTIGEQLVAKAFMQRKAAVVLSSALEIAAFAGSSDATVVRTAKSLGYSSLSELRQALLNDLVAPSPSDRLSQTLDESGKDGSGPLHHVISVHEEVLALLKTKEMADHLRRASEILAAANHRHVFGIGPSGAMAQYATLQFNRLGLLTTALTIPGVGLADGLIGFRRGDAVLMMAYGPLYREADVALDEAERVGLPVVLISDDLGAVVGDRVAELLPVPRGRANHLAMHSGTMLLLEALSLSLAGVSTGRSIDTLDRFSAIRASIDKTWSRRGARKMAGKR